MQIGGSYGARAKRFQFGRIGNVFIKRAGVGLLRSETDLHTLLQVERSGPDGGAAGAPGRQFKQAPPRVRPGFKLRVRRYKGFGRTVLQVSRHDRPQNFPTKVEGGVAVELQGIQAAALLGLLPVMPAAHHQKDLTVAGALGLDGLVDGDGIEGSRDMNPPLGFISKPVLSALRANNRYEIFRVLQLDKKLRLAPPSIMRGNRNDRPSLS
ncbi:MAG TPA: hypothetical protein VNM47_07375 [Terriglobia bacterium]|nr:hypothetical protein [Terriglobia bacterium]